MVQEPDLAGGAPREGSEVRVARLDQVVPAESGSDRVGRAGHTGAGVAPVGESAAVADLLGVLPDGRNGGTGRVAVVDDLAAGSVGGAPVARLAGGDAGSASTPRRARLDGLSSDNGYAEGGDLAGPAAAESGAGGDRRRRRRSSGQASGATRGPDSRAGASDELDPDADPVAVAREICLRLLTDRARTRQELAQALRRKGVPDEAAGIVLERFDEVGLIDDAAFAGQWVRSRHKHRGLARRAIAMELRRKGVADDVAGEALGEVDAESEERRARALVDRKLRSFTVDTTEQRAAAGRRLVGLLARKGYGAGIAYQVVREAIAQNGADGDELGADEPPEN